MPSARRLVGPRSNRTEADLMGRECRRIFSRAQACREPRTKSRRACYTTPTTGPGFSKLMPVRCAHSSSDHQQRSCRPIHVQCSATTHYVLFSGALKSTVLYKQFSAMVTGTGSVAQGAPVTTNNIKNDISADTTLPPRRTSDNRRVSTISSNITAQLFLKKALLSCPIRPITTSKILDFSFKFVFVFP